MYREPTGATNRLNLIFSDGNKNGSNITMIVLSSFNLVQLIMTDVPELLVTDHCLEDQPDNKLLS